MKIAVPITKENYIDSHFGHCESYGVFTISEKNDIAGIKRLISLLLKQNEGNGKFRQFMICSSLWQNPEKQCPGKII